MFARAHTCPHCTSHLPRAAARCLVCGSTARGTAPAAAAATQNQPLSAVGPASAAPVPPHQDLPPIYLTTGDHRRLADLARSRLRSGHAIAWFLMAELERAILCRPENIPADAVTMNSRVLFQVGAEGQVESGVLAYPDQHVPMQQHVSVLTPLGMALLGLRKGDRMPFEDWNRRKHSVTVTKVAFQPEVYGRGGRQSVQASPGPLEREHP